MPIEEVIANKPNRIIGHKAPQQVLSKLTQAGRLPHALLFSGPAAIGKWTLARNFAASLFAAKDNFSDQQLTSILQNGHPDLHLVFHETGSKDISVDKIRQLKDNLSLSAYYGGYKVALIDDAHKMNIAASNALLKTLEEPADNTILILVSDCINRIPETIVSRCQIIHFSFLEEEESKQLLKEVTGELELDNKHLKALSSICSGSLELLSLNSFIDPNSKAWEEKKEAKQHLEGLLQNYKYIKDTIASVHVENAVQSCSSLLADKEKRSITLKIIKAILRENLRSATSDEIGKYAEAIDKFSEVERLIIERNANPENQLSSFLLSL